MRPSAAKAGFILQLSGTVETVPLQNSRVSWRRLWGSPQPNSNIGPLEREQNFAEKVDGGGNDEADDAAAEDEDEEEADQPH